MIQRSVYQSVLELRIPLKHLGLIIRNGEITTHHQTNDLSQGFKKSFHLLASFPLSTAIYSVARAGKKKIKRYHNMLNIGRNYVTK